MKIHIIGWGICLGVLLSIAVVQLPGRASEAPAPCALHATDLRIPESPPGVQVNAAYGSITNLGKAAVVLAAFRSPVFASIELHESTMHDGMTSMHPLHKISLEPQRTLQLEPNGKHLMLMGRTRPLRVGDLVPLEIVGASGCVSPVQMVVVDSRAAH